MARIVLAWELGGGMGHVVPMAQVAGPLLQRGHTLHFVLRDLSGATAALGNMATHPQLHLWQAPVWMPQLLGLPAPASYAELLFMAGYLNAQRLGALVDAWQSLFKAIQPDLLLADHAPTALLAARGQPMRRALMGTGFFLPPAASPMPAFREWERFDPQRLLASEARVVAVCNEVLAQRGQPVLPSLQALTQADEVFALTWPELDHYSPGPHPNPQGRPGVTYWGAMPGRDEGQNAQWPVGDGAAVFAYLKSDHAAVESALQQLSQAPWRTLAYVPGLTPEQQRRFASERLRFSAGPVSMRSAMAQARVVLCNAGSGTVCTALQAGVPVLMLPMHAEQLLFARRVVAAGVGGMLMDADVATKLRPTLARLVDDPVFHNRAKAMAQTHSAQRYGDVAQRVALRCEALANAAQTSTPCSSKPAE